MGTHTIDELIAEIKQGKMIVLMDDEDRENEGDLIMAAQCVTADAINFMAKHARGLICMPLSHARCDRLRLPLMTQENLSGFGTKFTVSIEAATGVTTGISAADRARTVQVAADPNATAHDIVSPGHIFPLRAQPGGVLARAGHTEAACDLSRLAGWDESGVICEIMNDDGSMARRPELEEFAKLHGLKMGTIADLIQYRLMHERTVIEKLQRKIQTQWGEFELHVYQDTMENKVHLAMLMGDPSQEPTLVRVHNMDPLQDLLHVKSYKRWTLRDAMERVAEAGHGVVLLLGCMGDGFGDLLQQLQTDNPRMENIPTHAYRSVGVGSQILRDMGVRKMRLMSSPRRFNAISGFGLEVVEYIEPL